ncbi:MAG: hypothetical protein AABX05_03695, partial [Nanoarchaeota archaeon]
LDSGFKQEPMINTLLTNYNIIEYPAVVIEDKILQGHQSTEQLMDSICKEFKMMKGDVPPDCLN